VLQPNVYRLRVYVKSPGSADDLPRRSLVAVHTGPALRALSYHHVDIKFWPSFPAPAPQAAVPHQIVQVVHARKTGSRAQQDCVYVKFLPPIPCGPHAPTSENAALHMSADEAAVVLRSTFAVQACTFAVQTCQKTFKIFPLEPPLKLSSARASGLHDTGSSHGMSTAIKAALPIRFWGSHRTRTRWKPSRIYPDFPFRSDLDGARHATRT
jgi:hypothetical protein